MASRGEPSPIALAKLLAQAHISSDPRPVNQEPPATQDTSYYTGNQHRTDHRPPSGQRFSPRTQRHGNYHPGQPQTLPLTAFMRAGQAIPGPGPGPTQHNPQPLQYGSSAGAFHSRQLYANNQGNGHDHRQYQHQGFRNHQQVRAPPYGQITAAQDAFLESILKEELPKVIATEHEIQYKYGFLEAIEARAREEFWNQHKPKSMFNLIPYGSIESGFATKGSDVDTVVVWDPRQARPTEEELAALPRLLEQTLLRHNWGARLLAHTRVPVLKVCANPSPELLQALNNERLKWELSLLKESQEIDNSDPGASETPHSNNQQDTDPKEPQGQEPSPAEVTTPSRIKNTANGKVDDPLKPETLQATDSHIDGFNKETETPQQTTTPGRRWRRERPPGLLDYPADAAPLIDISFSTDLGILNTKLLRCYSLCDRRVIEMVHFIKSWAKHNKLASAYNGTLCSYGWVLMVLHYLINVVTPPVLPNLQADYPHMPLLINDVDVGFFDNPMQIIKMIEQGSLFGGAASNAQKTSALLRGFFHYYAHQGPRVIGGGFRWRDDVISLRTSGGLVSKSSKGWVSSASTTVNGVEVKQRYLLAIECPIEVGHNVARTVVHHGIVGIRDELRRAWNILEGVGFNKLPEPGKGLMDYQFEEEDQAGQPDGMAKLPIDSPAEKQKIRPA